MNLRHLQEVHIYTDGACRGNDSTKSTSPGGTGICIMTPAEEILFELSGFYEESTTNNRKEVRGIIEALKIIRSWVDQKIINPGTTCIIIADSMYALNGAFKWMHGWMKNHIIDEKLNPDLWKECYPLFNEVNKVVNLEWKYVKGHSGVKGNERADALANAAIDKKIESQSFYFTDYARKNYGDGDEFYVGQNLEYLGDDVRVAKIAAQDLKVLYQTRSIYESDNKIMIEVPVHPHEIHTLAIDKNQFKELLIKMGFVCQN